jgi:DNA-3-methyladenine glycosylase II
MERNLNKQIVNHKDIQSLIKKDKIFAHIHDAFGHPPNWIRPQGFVSLSKIILEQQVSLSSANAHFLKLHTYLGEFTPLNILKLNDIEMRSCQVSRQKATYLRALSTAILDGVIDFGELHELNEDEIRKRLTAIKGIGVWTTDIYLMFCMQSKDIFPLGDIAIIKTVKELSDANTKEEIARLSGKWKPFRSLASYFLWHHYLKKRNRPSG